MFCYLNTHFSLPHGFFPLIEHKKKRCTKCIKMYSVKTLGLLSICLPFLLLLSLPHGPWFFQNVWIWNACASSDRPGTATDKLSPLQWSLLPWLLWTEELKFCYTGLGLFSQDWVGTCKHNLLLINIIVIVLKRRNWQFSVLSLCFLLEKPAFFCTCF